jgi:hypothetical protein
MGDLLRRRPALQDGEADPLAVELAEKIGEAPIGKRRAMPVFVGASEPLLIACDALGRHDEGNVGRRRADQLQRRDASLHCAAALAVAGAILPAVAPNEAA